MKRKLPFNTFVKSEAELRALGYVDCNIGGLPGLTKKNFRIFLHECGEPVRVVDKQFDFFKGVLLEGTESIHIYIEEVLVNQNFSLNLPDWF